METALSIALGLGLSVACGFRVFVPFLIASVASFLGYLPLADGFEWIGTVPAVIAFGTATLVEIAAYSIPGFDNLADSVSTPVAVIAGVVAAASVMTEMSPLLRWSIALIGGGGAAGLVQGTTAVLRAGSSVATGGIANIVLATLEWLGSAITAILAILFPAIAFLLSMIIIFAITRVALRIRSRKGYTASSPETS